jgi:voltage-gated potassium channel
MGPARMFPPNLRRRCYELLESGSGADRSSRVVDGALVLLILLNIVVVVFESIPAVDARYRLWFDLIEIVSLVVFSIEYGVRIWSAPEHAPLRDMTAWRARRAFMLSPAGIVDLFAVLPFWLTFVVPADLRVVLVFRIVRFFKLARYSPGMRSLLDAVYAERRALSACLVVFSGTTLFSAALMHLAERDAQPDKLGTLPDAIWWAVVTLGTIGYGDVVPVTVAGKLIAGMTILFAIAMIALPAGIIATAFAEEIHRRDFVVTWGMVARVRLFAGLDAAEVADVMRLLRAQTVEPGEIIARRGDPAQSMYFIARGQVEIDLKEQRIKLGVGQFFGEIAVLRRARRSGTVTAIGRTNLLVLDAADLRALMERDPRIAERIHAVVRDRLGPEALTPKGDMATQEIV